MAKKNYYEIHWKLNKTSRKWHLLNLLNHLENKKTGKYIFPYQITSLNGEQENLEQIKNFKKNRLRWKYNIIIINIGRSYSATSNTDITTRN